MLASPAAHSDLLRAAAGVIVDLQLPTLRALARRREGYVDRTGSAIGQLLIGAASRHELRLG